MKWSHSPWKDRSWIVSNISLDSVPAKAQPKNKRDARRGVRAFKLRGLPCRRVKKAIRKIRNRRPTKIGLRACRHTSRRKTRQSRPAAGSEKRPDAKATWVEEAGAFSWRQSSDFND